SDALERMPNRKPAIEAAAAVIERISQSCGRSGSARWSRIPRIKPVAAAKAGRRLRTPSFTCRDGVVGGGASPMFLPPDSLTAGAARIQKLLDFKQGLGDGVFHLLAVEHLPDDHAVGADQEDGGGAAAVAVGEIGIV